jgi:hypothetical protein
MKNLAVFYHLYIPDTSGMWVWWVDEQMGLLKSSGLADEAKVFMCITMPTNLVGKIKKYEKGCKFDPLDQQAEYIDVFFEKPILDYIMETYPFVNILNVRGIQEENIYEGQTLNEVYKYAKNNDAYVLYFHSKGVLDTFFRVHGLLGQDKKWRHHMQKYCVEGWKDCVKKLDEGYDAVGTNFDSNYYPFAGNFWWASTDHIRKLKNPLYPQAYNQHYTKENHRFNFELWIGTEKPKIFYMDQETEEQSQKVYSNKIEILEETSKTMSQEPIKNYAQVKTNKFNLVRIVPDNGFDVHAQVFHEIEASVFFSLQKLGYDVTNSVNDFASGRRNIVFGMHHCPVDVVRHDIPKDTIVYSLEQMKEQPECLRWCRKYRGLEVWDYSTRNIEILKKTGVENIKHCKIGYVPEISYFERNKPEERDIDILAYMCPSPRRQHIMKQFENNPNINFVLIQSTYGDARDEYIKRAKLVINLHNYDNQIFEMVRVSHLIQNKVPVLCERNPDTDFPDYMEDTVFTSTYNRFVDTAYKLLKKPEELDAQAEKGLEIFKKSPMENFLKEVLE